MSKTVSILLPVYGRSELLRTALDSVRQQDRPEWNPLIADDGSDEWTQKSIAKWVNTSQDPRIRWSKRAKNLGLFGNLNQAIEEAEDEWVLILCSDDILLPNAISRVQACRQHWPESGLILSTYESIDKDGGIRPKDSAKHHDQLCMHSGLIRPNVFIPALLRLGSVNGNLTGMAFSKELWRQAGPFREDWRHAGDWEWLIRAGEVRPMTMNRVPIAKVRTHAGQLSNENRRNGSEIVEVGEVVRMLVSHPLLNDEKNRDEWAAHIMQFQLWNVLKSIRWISATNAISALTAIRKSAGMWHTVISMVRWLPERWNRRFK